MPSRHDLVGPSQPKIPAHWLSSPRLSKDIGSIATENRPSAGLTSQKVYLQGDPNTLSGSTQRLIDRCNAGCKANTYSRWKPRICQGFGKWIRSRRVKKLGNRKNLWSLPFWSLQQAPNCWGRAWDCHPRGNFVREPVTAMDASRSKLNSIEANIISVFKAPCLVVHKVADLCAHKMERQGATL